MFHKGTIPKGQKCVSGVFRGGAIARQGKKITDPQHVDRKFGGQGLMDILHRPIRFVGIFPFIGAPGAVLELFPRPADQLRELLRLGNVGG